MSETTPNQYPGSCARCGAKVPANQGTYQRLEGVAHTTEDDCKKTTKTWNKYVNHREFDQARTDINTAWKTAGFNGTPECSPSTSSFESGTTGWGAIDGHRFRYVRGSGRYEDSEVTWNTVRVYTRTGSSRDLEIGRFNLDRAAIEAAGRAVENGHRASVARHVEEITQMVANIRTILNGETT